MTIIISKQGQLANRIWHACHLIANAIEYDYKVYSICFSDYYPFFSETLERKETKQFFKVFRFDSKISTLVIGKAVGLIRKVSRFNKGNFFIFQYVQEACYAVGQKPNTDLNSQEFVRKAKKICLIDGWGFWDHPNILKHREQLVDLWRPNKEYIDTANEIIERLRSESDILIGVHIRRGDYKFFNNGLFYFEFEFYREKMKEIESLPKFINKKVCFVICSNEPTEQTMFEGLNVDTNSRNLIVDILLLSECDYIIGPLSTFSDWAAYYGYKPLLSLTKDMPKIHISHFIDAESRLSGYKNEN